MNPASLRARAPLQPLPTCAERFEQLTPRERDVALLCATGLTDDGIADRLGLARETIKHHMRNIRSALGTPTRTEAALTVYRALVVQRCTRLDAAATFALLDQEVTRALDAVC